MREFSDLHRHSEFSLLDGYASIKKHAKRANELGHRYLAMTEHGTLRGFPTLGRACDALDLLPIYGCELYVTRNHLRKSISEEEKAALSANLKKKEASKAIADAERAAGIQERRHLVVLAKNDEGLQNLIKLSNIANLDGFYYKPRIDLELLGRYREGLIVNSGCIGGVLARSYFNGDLDRMLDDLEWFIETFGDDFSLEIQPHPIEEQAEWNKIVLRLSKEFDVPIVAANDTHYPHPDDWKTHDTLICVGMNEKVMNCERMQYEAATFGMKSGDDMVEAFARTHPYIPRKVVEAAVERAAELAERCTARLVEPKEVYLPSVSGDPDEDTDQTLRDLCEKGLEWRGLSGDEYSERLEHELGVIQGKKFSLYFLVVHEMVSWCRENGVLTGPGRGSAAGSLVCYLLGITSLDPIEHGLLFERFLTPGRIDWPDIDVDFEDSKREEVIEHLCVKYGKENVAHISTHLRMRARGALKDVSRAHGLNLFEVENLTSAIVEEATRIDPDEEQDVLKRAIESTEDLRLFAERNPDVAEHAMRIEGHIRTVGIHASGIVVSPKPLRDCIPLERRLSKGKEVFTIAYDMRDTEKAGFVKLDALGLRTLSILADCCRLVERRTGVRLDLEKLPLDDRVTLDAFTDHDFAGVFQFDTAAARGACSGVSFDTFEDIVALNALNRPGPAKSGLADQWRERKAKGKWKRGHPIVERICSDTMGVIVYQEHVIRILQQLAGYSPEEAGRLRKAISKSKGAGYLEKERPTFVEGAVKSGMDETTAEMLWTSIEEFGAYGFNKSHAAAYSLIAYWGQWLKQNYPVEFFCALLRNEPDTGKANGFVREASRRGIKITPPNVNYSDASWTCKGKKLVTGLASVKRCGERACEEIHKHAPYSDFADLESRVNRRIVNRGVIKALVQAGAMGDLLPNTRWTLANLEPMMKLIGKKGWVEKVREKIDSSRSEPDLTDAQKWRLRLKVGVNGDGRHPLGSVKEMIDKHLRHGFVPLEKAFDGSWVFAVVSGKKTGTSDGKRWAAMEIEDERGDRVKLKFGDSEFTRWRPIFDAGVGTLVAVNIHVTHYGNSKVVSMVDLIDLSQKIENGEELTEVEQVFVRNEHPIRKLKYADIRSDWWRDPSSVVLVVGLKTRFDRNRQKMAFVRVDSGMGATIEVLVFASVYEANKKLFKVGKLVNLRGKMSDGRFVVKSVHKVKGQAKND